MSTRECLDSLTKEQRSAWLRISGVTFQICMALMKENNFRIGVKKRYDFADNMMR
jgi:hypothetical protein